MTTDDYLDDAAKLALTPEMRAALAHRLETDRRGANTIPAPNPHPFSGWSKAYPGSPFGDIYRPTIRLPDFRVIDHIQTQVDMLADMLAALDTTPEGTDPS